MGIAGGETSELRDENRTDAAGTWIVVRILVGEKKVADAI